MAINLLYEGWMQYIKLFVGYLTSSGAMIPTRSNTQQRAQSIISQQGMAEIVTCSVSFLLPMHHFTS